MRKIASLFTVLMLLCALAFGQTHTITGTVTDENGNPVPYATITEAGTNNATTADANGNYSITIKHNSRLTISATGFTSQTNMPGAATQNFKLARGESQLSEVVVTAIQTTRNKSSVVYGTQTVRNDALNAVTNKSALNALQGKVAGVKIGQASGAPGASTRVVLRGETSLTQGNNALIVVDGVPMNNSTSSGGGGTGKLGDRDNYVDFGNRANDINPEDIDNVTVLKGPAATSLYGSRGSSGVILITTKKGRAREGSPKISIGSSISRDEVYLIMKQQDRYGSGYKTCNGCGGGADIFMGENFNWGAELDGKMIPWTAIPYDENGEPLPLNNGKIEQLIRPYSAVEDHLKEFFDIGTTNRNNISVDGGNNKYTYYLSFTNYNNEGIVPHSDYHRNNVLINANAKFTDKFTSSFSMNYSKTNQRGVTEGGYAFGYSSGTPAYAFALQTPVNIPFQEMRDFNSPYQDLKGFYAQFSVNPYFILANQDVRNTVDNLLSSVNLNYAFTKEFSVNGRASTNFSTSSVTEKNPQFRYLNALSWLDGGLSDFGAERENSTFSLGSYKESMARRIDLNFDLLASYNKALGSNYNLSASAGFNSLQQESRIVTGTTSGGLNVPGFYDLSNSKELPIAANASTKYRLFGGYLNASLGYKNMLFLEYSARNDWSSTLPEGDRGFFYQAAGVSFLASNIIKTGKNTVSFLKFRGNVGTTGKDAPLYRLDNYFNFNPIILDIYGDDYQIALPFNGEAGSRRSNLIGNPGLKPELTVTYEGGVDMGLLNDRINLEYTYYYSDSKDQIVDANLPWSSGFALFPINVGRMTNQGHELVLRGTPIKNNTIEWKLFLTYSRNRNKVKSIAPQYGLKELNIYQNLLHFVGHGTLNLVAAEGLPFGTFKGTDFEHDSSGNLVVDATGVPIHSLDQKYLGSYQPDFLSSFGTDFSYRGFTLHALFDARKGGLFYSGTKLSTEFNGTALTTLKNDRKPFVVPNSVVKVDGAYEKNTVETSAYDYLHDIPASTFLLDASYLKLRELALTYNFTNSLLSKTPFSAGSSISLFARNLKYWVAKENTFADPEVGGVGGSSDAVGIETSTTPTARSFGVELRLTIR